MVAATLSGCSYQTYVIGRAVRHVMGTATRFHPITPPEGSFARYRIIEVQPLDNMLADRLPADVEQYINAAIVRQLHQVKGNPAIAIYDAEGTPTEPTLVFEGFIDDYDPGYLGLRLVELGFNHIAVTVRFRLRDKQTGQIMEAASITAQDDRVTATSHGAINRIAKRIRTFVNSGYGRKP
jgi:hypothetical protein